jgi:hypothetical protein
MFLHPLSSLPAYVYAVSRIPVRLAMVVLQAIMSDIRLSLFRAQLSHPGKEELNMCGIRCLLQIQLFDTLHTTPYLIILHFRNFLTVSFELHLI